VAYTAGPRKSKQIHLSSTYIATLPDARLHDEILGVIRHQMAHALQHDGDSTAPMGLIEGIADWVQLCDGVVHSSWESGGGDDSGEGCQYTAYFLEWLCARYGEPMVKDINAYLGKRNYAKSMWRELFGVPVEVLWTEYKTHCDLSALPPAEEKRPAVCNHTPQEPVVISTVVGDAVDNTAHRAAPASPHERTLVIVDQETEATVGIESLASASSESEFDPFPYHTEAAMVDIFSARLRALTYDGSRDARRFIKEFEALVERVNPQIRDEDKRLLLVCIIPPPHSPQMICDGCCLTALVERLRHSLATLSTTGTKRQTWTMICRMRFSSSACNSSSRAGAAERWESLIGMRS